MRTPVGQYPARQDSLCISIYNRQKYSPDIGLTYWQGIMMNLHASRFPAHMNKAGKMIRINKPTQAPLTMQACFGSIPISLSGDTM